MAKQPKTPEGFDPNFAHITGKDGTIYQVLNAKGTDWDEAATRAAAAEKGAAKADPDA